MEPAVAVRIASEITGRMHHSVSPYLLERLLQARHDPKAGLKELSRLIKMDPALCFMALHLDRTMGPNVPVTEPLVVDRVVERIGMAGVDAIATQSAADLALPGIHRQQGLALTWLWRDALTTALLSRELARELDIHPLEEAYLAGLLNSIGKLALVTRTPASCTPMLWDPAQANALLDAEATVVGSDYGRIGSWLIRRYTGAWTAAEAAEFITEDATAMKNAFPLTRLVWAADRISTADPATAHDRLQVAALLLGMDHQRVKRIADEVAARVTATGDDLNIAAGPMGTDPWYSERDTVLTQTVAIQTVLSSVFGQLLTAVDRDAIMRILHGSLDIFLGIEALILMDHDLDGGRLIGRFAAGRNFPQPVDRLTIPLDATNCLPVACHTANTPMASFSRSRREAPTIIDRQLMAYLGKDGIVCMPLRWDGDKGGACLILGVDNSDWPYIEQRQPLLTAIAAGVGASIQRTHRLKPRIDGSTADRAIPDMARTRKIVHEINNPLSIIKNYLSVFARRTGDPSTRDELRIINEELNRVAELIKSLTAPSAPATRNLEPVDVNAVILDIVELFRDGLPPTPAIALRPDLDDNLPMIASDRNRLKQVLMNLLKNAMEAMPGGGTIQVRTRAVDDDGRPVGDSESVQRIKISVCDDGPGVDEGVKNDLFNPHVTSKTGHDGLGLTIVHETVSHLKGSLQLESTPGLGTCFHIELPTGSNAS